MQTIYVPTIGDSREDYYKLFAIWRQAVQSPHGAVFDFSQCGDLRPNAVAFLGGIARLCEHHGKRIAFDWSTLRVQVLFTLCQNGFAERFGQGIRPWIGHSIPYREDRTSAQNSVADYLTDQWLGKGWLNVSELLRDAIVGKVLEIYANSFEHAQSPIGVFSCGQHFDSENELILSVVDFGTGIPSKVRHFLKLDPRMPGIPSSAILQWAFKQGNSTAAGVVPRGLGLDLLREFVTLNNGSLEVYSEDSYALIDKNGDQFVDLPSKFNGTAVTIKLICDARIYRFANEVKG
ncbi:ATP-binding protein [Burkholderia cepacia]|uniref:ATP-binding protein n=1 Tax=Burkholderia cepacia TaxID=292 RepID=UPI0009BD9B87|nr:ATP-binding protein [Burkholderia cepacia]